MKRKKKEDSLFPPDSNSKKKKGRRVEPVKGVQTSELHLSRKELQINTVKQKKTSENRKTKRARCLTSPL